MRPLIAVAVASVFAAAHAQQPAGEAPPWKQGMNPEQASSTLHPFAPHMTGRDAKELPLNTLKVPAGFKVEVWAEGIPEARSLALGDKGTVFVSNRLAKNVYAVVDKLDPTKQAGHFWKYLALGPDGKLYFNIGSPGNIVMPSYMQASVMRV